MTNKIFLQCGWEDDCEAKDCLNCPKTHIVELKLTEAEMCCIEDFAVCDIELLMKEQPEEFELSQQIIHQLAKKIFHEVIVNDD